MIKERKGSEVGGCGWWGRQGKMRLWKDIDSHQLSPNFLSSSPFFFLLCPQRQIVQMISQCSCGFKLQPPRNRSEKEGKWGQDIYSSRFHLWGYFGLTVSNIMALSRQLQLPNYPSRPNNCSLCAVSSLSYCTVCVGVSVWESACVFVCVCVSMVYRHSIPIFVNWSFVINSSLISLIGESHYFCLGIQ